jgi:hypothetical protein
VGILNLVLLVALGLLGIASFIRSRNPQAEGPLAQLEAVGGWIGLVGLILGLLAIVQLILNLGVLMAVPVHFIFALAIALAITALSLILAMPMLKTLIGANPFTLKLEALAAQLSGFKVILGGICLALAVYSLVMMF